MHEGRNENILELHNITKNFGGLKAVNDVSLNVKEGDLHCLIGPNGAGKTTIFKLIVGAYKLNNGSVFFDGKNISNLETHRRIRNGISIKMQIPGVFHELTLRENIRIAVQNNVPSSQLEDEIDRLIDMVGIANLGNPFVKNMPHGQQQWLEIAMSLGSKPKLLLLDEPAAGMGPEETEFTAEMIKKINKMGLTIIFIDHDMDFVKRIAEKVTVLHYGKVFAEGSIDEIQRNQDVINIYLGKV